MLNTIDSKISSGDFDILLSTYEDWNLKFAIMDNAAPLQRGIITQGIPTTGDNFTILLNATDDNEIAEVRLRYGYDSILSMVKISKKSRDFQLDNVRGIGARRKQDVFEGSGVQLGTPERSGSPEGRFH